MDRGRGEVDQEPDPGTAALAFDAGREAGCGVLGMVDGQPDPLAGLTEDELVAFERVARLFLDPNPPGVADEEGAEWLGLLQVEGVGSGGCPDRS
jgi:hypothetical protein